MLDVAQQFGPFPGERPAAPEQVAGGAPLCEIDIGLRAHPATEQPRNLVGIDRVVFGLAPADGLHRQGMPKHERHPHTRAEVREPGPR
jgi:hypothetical protein